MECPRVRADERRRGRISSHLVAARQQRAVHHTSAEAIRSRQAAPADAVRRSSAPRAQRDGTSPLSARYGASSSARDGALSSARDGTSPGRALSSSSRSRGSRIGRNSSGASEDDCDDDEGGGGGDDGGGGGGGVVGGVGGGGPAEYTPRERLQRALRAASPHLYCEAGSGSGSGSDSRVRPQSAARAISPRAGPPSARDDVSLSARDDASLSTRYGAPSSARDGALSSARDGAPPSAPSPRRGSAALATAPLSSRTGSGAVSGATVSSARGSARPPSPRRVGFQPGSDQAPVGNGAPCRAPSTGRQRPPLAAPYRAPSPPLAAPPAAPPPARAASSRERMAELAELLKLQLISQEEYDSKRKAILDAI